MEPSGSRSSVPAGSSSRTSADRRAELAHHEHVIAEERHDADRARVLDDLARVATAVDVLDGVDAEGDEAAPMEARLLARTRGLEQRCSSDMSAQHTASAGPGPGCRRRGGCVHANPVLVRLPHGGGPAGRQDAIVRGTPRPSPSLAPPPDGPRPDLMGDDG